MYFLFYIIYYLKLGLVHGILGGHDISITEAPYQINYADICGGVLIHRLWALTAAHCGTEKNYIRIGSKYHLMGPKIKIKSHIIHSRFGKEHVFDFDVQLLRLFRPLHFGRNVRAATISNVYGSTIYVFGWGYPEEKGEYKEILQKVQLRIVPVHQCQHVKKFWYNHTLTPRMFCAGGDYEDACQGDSGGAAIASGYLVGLSSFGFGCGRHIPGVFTNLSDIEIRSWIQYHTGV